MHLCFDNPQKDHPANVFSDFDCLQKCDGGLGMEGEEWYPSEGMEDISDAERDWNALL